MLFRSYPEAAPADGPIHEFDRTQPFGHRDKLDYRVVVNWVIAAHKSQGTMQLAMNKGERERFFVLEIGRASCRERVSISVVAVPLKKTHPTPHTCLHFCLPPSPWSRCTVYARPPGPCDAPGLPPR